VTTESILVVNTIPAASQNIGFGLLLEIIRNKRNSRNENNAVSNPQKIFGNKYGNIKKDIPNRKPPNNLIGFKSTLSEIETNTLVNIAPKDKEAMILEINSKDSSLNVASRIKANAKRYNGFV
jgi:hypothetical protein